MQKDTQSPLNNKSRRSLGRILNFIITAIIILLVVFGAIFGFLLLRRKLSGKISDRERQRAQQLEVLDKALNNLRATDADLDGLSAEQEKQYGTDPTKSDTDGDGVLDKTEIEIWKTDPLKADTDGDGYVDGYEVRRGFNPLGEGKIKY